MRGKAVHVYCSRKTFSLNDIEMLLLSKRSLFSEQYNKNKLELERLDFYCDGTWQLSAIPLSNHLIYFMPLERPIDLAGLRNDCWIHLWVAINWRSIHFQSSYLSGSVKRAPFMQMQIVSGIRRPICSSLMKVHLNIGFQRNNNDDESLCSLIRPFLLKASPLSFLLPHSQSPYPSSCHSL